MIKLEQHFNKAEYNALLSNAIYIHSEKNYIAIKEDYKFYACIFEEYCDNNRRLIIKNEHNTKQQAIANVLYQVHIDADSVNVTESFMQACDILALHIALAL